MKLNQVGDIFPGDVRGIRDDRVPMAVRPDPVLSSDLGSPLYHDAYTLPDGLGGLPAVDNIAYDLLVVEVSNVPARQFLQPALLLIDLRFQPVGLLEDCVQPEQRHARLGGDEQYHHQCEQRDEHPGHYRDELRRVTGTQAEEREAAAADPATHGVPHERNAAAESNQDWDQQDAGFHLQRPSSQVPEEPEKSKDLPHPELTLPALPIHESIRNLRHGASWMCRQDFHQQFVPEPPVSVSCEQIAPHGKEP